MNNHNDHLGSRLLPILPIFLLLSLAACDTAGTPTPAQPASAPADLSVTYEYRAGSVPPPFHNEYTVVIGPGTTGQVTYRPDYPSDTTPTWTEVLTPTTAQLNDLYTLLQENNLLRDNWRELGDPPVGGSVEWATITADGKTYEIPQWPEPADSHGPQALYEFVTKTLVPQSVWDSLEAQRTQFQEDFENRQP